MTNVMIEISQFFFSMSSDVLAFKFHIFASDFEFWIGVKTFQLKFCWPYCYPLINLQGVNWKLNISHQMETIYDKLIIFCQIGKAIKVKRVSKIWVRMYATNIHLLQFKILKLLINMWTLNASTSGLQPRRNRLKYLTLHLPFCLLIRKKKNTQTEWPSWVPYFGIYYSWWNYQMHLKMVHLNIKNAKSGADYSQVCNLRTTHSLVLKVSLLQTHATFWKKT